MAAGTLALFRWELDQTGSLAGAQTWSGAHQDYASDETGWRQLDIPIGAWDSRRLSGRGAGRGGASGSFTAWGCSPLSVVGPSRCVLE